MAEICVPAYVKKTEYMYCDKCKHLVDCDKGDNLKFKCDIAFVRNLRKKKFCYYILIYMINFYWIKLVM